MLLSEQKCFIAVLSSWTRFRELVQLRWTAQFLGVYPAGVQQGAEQLHCQHREHREHQHVASQGKSVSMQNCVRDDGCACVWDIARASRKGGPLFLLTYTWSYRGVRGFEWR